MASLAVTYVWHESKCFLVSTINRGSSDSESYGSQYAETLVWEFDRAARTRGAMAGRPLCHATR